MDNFKIIYKILRALERSMDTEEFVADSISADNLGISESRWKKIMKLLADEGYVDGVRVIQTNTGEIIVKFVSPGITLKGLEYLEDNSMMKRAAKMAKGIVDVLPG